MHQGHDKYPYMGPYSRLKATIVGKVNTWISVTIVRMPNSLPRTICCLSVCPSIYSYVPVAHKTLCNQLLRQFSGNQFENLQRFYNNIEDVHVTF